MRIYMNCGRPKDKARLQVAPAVAPARRLPPLKAKNLSI